MHFSQDNDLQMAGKADQQHMKLLGYRGEILTLQ